MLIILTKTQEKLKQILPEEVFNFLLKVGDYCHLLDDIIDENEFKTPEQLFKLQSLFLDILSSDIYSNKLRFFLYPVFQQMLNTYADSVKWEHSDIEWKKQHADILRCCGNEVTFVLVKLFAGYETMREISSLIREEAYNRQHNEKGECI